MQSTAIEVNQTRQRPRGVVINIQFGARRGVPLPGGGADQTAAMIEQALGKARLDASTREQMLRILSVTVREWMRK
jgi:hypothetical protein